MEKQKNIPELRFPGYTDYWISKKIDNYIDFLSGHPFDGEEISEDSSGIPLMRGINITEGRIRHSNEMDRFYNGDTTKLKKYFLKEGDLVIGMDGSKVGKNSAIVDLINANSILVQRVARLREKSNSSLLFIYHYINSIRFHKYVDEVKTSSGIPHISAAQIKDFKIALPSLPEQQKIASFLTAVADKLTHLKQKKSLLEKYKKGVMQKIFSQEIRFKDDNDKEFPKWEIKKLGDVCKIYDGTHQTPEYKEIGVPFYSVEHITSNNFSITKLISQEVFEAENKKVKLEKGDILMTKIGDIGTPKYIDWDVNASFYVSLALIKSTNSNNNEFICHFISSAYFQLELHKRTIHVAFPKKINLGEIGECRVMLPCLAEQTKIANFLSALDEKINHCQLQVEKTELYKKGLLQKMFC